MRSEARTYGADTLETLIGGLDSKLEICSFYVFSPCQLRPSVTVHIVSLLFTIAQLCIAVPPWA